MPDSCLWWFAHGCQVYMEVCGLNAQLSEVASKQHFQRQVLHPVVHTACTAQQMRSTMNAQHSTYTPCCTECTALNAQHNECTAQYTHSTLHSIIRTQLCALNVLHHRHPQQLLSTTIDTANARRSEKK